jgi:phosphate transport system substrate-binding protein
MKAQFNQRTLAVAILTILLPFVSKAQQRVIEISGNDQFTYPIIEKWIEEYNNENPASQGKFVLNKEASKTSTVRIIANPPLNKELDGDQRVAYLGRYALIPVLNSNNPLLSDLKNGINKKDLKKLVFERNLEDEEALDDFDSDKKEKYSATVYSRGSKASTSVVLAGYFGQQPDQIKGKKIIGDDIYLINAIRKDVSGLTFNSLNYVFDVETRKLKTDLSILPLKLKSQQQAALSSKDIDQTISLLETTSIESIPVQEFGLLVSSNYAKDKELVDFIAWILDKGQKFNNQLGFLKLDANALAQQKEQLKDVYYTQK